MIIILFLLIGSIEYFANLESNAFIQVIVPVILGVQLIFLLIQTLNQMNSNRYSLVGCSPILMIRADRPKRINPRGEEYLARQYEIRLVNNGLDAYNISFYLKINSNLIDTTNIPLFNLERGDNKLLKRISNKQFYESKIDIKVSFEGIICPLRTAYFKKDNDSEHFRTITKGI
jgi:hypothetical protein